ncbi:hypothetical protein [Mesorhizobium sp. B2-8-3]|uniref:hypothetical protein n=1 Tax=Mesorhizobium sp. B2-8-3 TaxID=2589905 RepID=UPI00112BB35A|nr:hypothetical protein [Mesorhizobium sp. B2-8-3]TPJ33997.1 hypothetical protein FJ418_11945 [Mesorhizobium sp. B2-8-3]
MVQKAIATFAIARSSCNFVILGLDPSADFSLMINLLVAGLPAAAFMAVVVYDTGRVSGALRRRQTPTIFNGKG